MSCLRSGTATSAFRRARAVQGAARRILAVVDYVLVEILFLLGDVLSIKCPDSPCPPAPGKTRRVPPVGHGRKNDILPSVWPDDAGQTMSVPTSSVLFFECAGIERTGTCITVGLSRNMPGYLC